mmetsp:Transcript_10273/g.16832  ORF Transcript_10273/g.16832 Transcript_10273/m.16832 type:complete len:92 (-) Transcript_10273:11-286(-)
MNGNELKQLSKDLIDKIYNAKDGSFDELRKFIDGIRSKHSTIGVKAVIDFHNEDEDCEYALIEAAVKKSDKKFALLVKENADVKVQDKVKC